MGTIIFSICFIIFFLFSVFGIVWLIEHTEYRIVATLNGKGEPRYEVKHQNERFGDWHHDGYFRTKEEAFKELENIKSRIADNDVTIKSYRVLK